MGSGVRNGRICSFDVGSAPEDPSREGVPDFVLGRTPDQYLCFDKIRYKNSFLFFVKGRATLSGANEKPDSDELVWRFSDLFEANGARRSYRPSQGRQSGVSEIVDNTGNGFSEDDIVSFNGMEIAAKEFKREIFSLGFRPDDQWYYVENDNWFIGFHETGGGLNAYCDGLRKKHQTSGALISAFQSFVSGLKQWQQAAVRTTKPDTYPEIASLAMYSELYAYLILH